MFEGKHYKHDIIRKQMGIFASLFNKLNVTHRGELSLVPIFYNARDGSIVRKEEQEDFETVRVKSIFPRISFGYTSIEPDLTRRLGLYQRTLYNTSDVLNRAVMSTPYPVNMNVELSIRTKSITDMHELIEQILPNFNIPIRLRYRPFVTYPSYTDYCDIVLTGNSPQIEYEGEDDTKRELVWTLNFEQRFNLFPNVEDGGGGPIHHIQLDFNDVSRVELFSTDGVKIETVYTYQDLDGPLPVIPDNVTGAPEPVSELTATVVNGQVELRWKDDRNEAIQYEVFRSHDPFNNDVSTNILYRLLPFSSSKFTDREPYIGQNHYIIATRTHSGRVLSEEVVVTVEREDNEAG